MEVVLPPKGRDLRLDLFRGLANWVIFIAHIPNNVVAYLMLGTGRYGFSDGADSSCSSRAIRHLSSMRG